MRLINNALRTDAADYIATLGGRPAGSRRSGPGRITDRYGVPTVRGDIGVEIELRLDTTAYVCLDLVRTRTERYSPDPPRAGLDPEQVEAWLAEHVEPFGRAWDAEQHQQQPPLAARSDWPHRYVRAADLLELLQVWLPQEIAWQAGRRAA